MAPDEELYGKSAERRARRRRSVITFLIVLLLLFFAAWYALSYIRADGARRADTTTSSTETSSATSCTLTPEQVEVNVFNATSREGLAAEVAGDLRKRGFVVTTVANDPKHAEITGRGDLRFGNDGVRPAELVGQHVGPFEERPDERKRKSVDIVLGPKYRHLASESTIEDC